MRAKVPTEESILLSVSLGRLTVPMELPSRMQHEHHAYAGKMEPREEQRLILMASSHHLVPTLPEMEVMESTILLSHCTFPTPI